MNRLPKRTRQAPSKRKTAPPSRTTAQRLDALEAAYLELVNAVKHLRVLKDSPGGVPVLPPGYGVALAEARLAAGWSGRELGAAMGKSHNFISLVERERAALLRIHAVQIEAIFREAGATPPAWGDLGDVR